MGLEVNLDARCDECGGSLGDGDEVYCEGCKEDLDKENQELQERVEELETALKICQANCKTCEHRIECVVNNEKKVTQ